MFPFPSLLLAPGRGRFTTWNASDVGSNVTLSNANLTATEASSATSIGRGNTSSTDEKRYFEVRVDAVGSATAGVGLARATEPLNGSQLGGSGDSVCYRSTGAVFISGSTLGTAATYTTGDTIGVAVNLSTSSIWVRVNGGNWNNSGTADPATGTGGFNSIGSTGTAYFPALGFGIGALSAYTASFLPIGNAPSGFKLWDE